MKALTFQEVKPLTTESIYPQNPQVVGGSLVGQPHRPPYGEDSRGGGGTHGKVRRGPR